MVSANVGSSGIFGNGGANKRQGLVSWKATAPLTFILPTNGKRQVSRSDVEQDPSNPLYVSILHTFSDNTGDFKARVAVRGSVSIGLGIQGVGADGRIELGKRGGSSDTGGDVPVKGSSSKKS